MRSAARYCLRLCLCATTAAVHSCAVHAVSASAEGALRRPQSQDIQACSAVRVKPACTLHHLTPARPGGSRPVHHDQLQRMLTWGAWVQSELPMRAPPPEAAPACLVMGGSQDIIMDQHGCQETADWCSGELAFLPDLAHDMMLVRASREPCRCALGCAGQANAVLDRPTCVHHGRARTCSVACAVLVKGGAAVHRQPQGAPSVSMLPWCLLHALYMYC